MVYYYKFNSLTFHSLFYVIIVVFVVSVVLFFIVFSMAYSLLYLLSLPVFGYDLLEPRVFRKQPLYFHKVGIRLLTHHPL